MADQVYKLLELTGTSDRSTDHAITCAVERAAKTVRNMRWFEVIETRGAIENGKVSAWQVTIKVGFKLDDAT
jgi:flavin-binding protein dodecin